MYRMNSKRRPIIVYGFGHSLRSAIGLPAQVVNEWISQSFSFHSRFAVEWFEASNSWKSLVSFEWLGRLGCLGCLESLVECSRVSIGLESVLSIRYLASIQEVARSINKSRELSIYFRGVWRLGKDTRETSSGASKLLKQCCQLKLLKLTFKTWLLR